MTDYNRLADALRLCSTRGVPCSKCPYFAEGFPYSCKDKLMLAAAEIIEKITEEESCRI